MIKNKKNAFTLVELLAVIVILAIILVIAVPQIMGTIKDSTKASLESSAKMVASQVENQYTVARTLNKEFGKTGNCMQDWAGLNETDYESCTYEIDDDGNAKVTLVGKGKFNGLSVCDGTRSRAGASEEGCSSAIQTGASYIASLCTDDTTCAANNLLKDVDGNIRYYGSDPNNYIEFNGETWRIIGVFNVKTNTSDTNEQSQQRIKIVRSDNIGTRVFDADNSNVWSGSDLETYLNGTTEGNYYYGLTSTAKEQISQVVWNTGAFASNSSDTTPMAVYTAEKTVQTSESIVGLASLSDYVYAGGSENTIVGQVSYIMTNWLRPAASYWIITPATSSSGIWYISASSLAIAESSNASYGGARPTVYLNSNVKLTGTGENTSEGIYKIS